MAEADGDGVGELSVYADKYDDFEKRFEAAANMTYDIQL